LVIAGSAPPIHYGAVLQQRSRRSSEIIVAMSKLSIIMPVLDEGDGIAAALDALADLRALGTEVIVVDGGSRDATVQRARLRADRVISAPRGRALQMNAGAATAAGNVLLFLHADTRLPPDADHILLRGLDRSGRVWGRFDVEIDGRNPLLAVIAALMNIRSRLTGIATGDQAIFVRRDAFQAAGAFAAIPLMEDVALCKRLKRVSRPLCLRERVVTSGRRWETNGVVRTVLLMWRLRFAYFFGADPQSLARQYGYE
jgi:rSAM/selenodomain-associated transferase 2